jgi:hypothetical protein
MPAEHDRLIEIAVNPNLQSTLARWIPPHNVLEISTAAKSRGARAFREIISHEAAHVVVSDRSGRGARPHGPVWAVPFVYCGDVQFMEWHGDRPITVKSRLPSEVPDAIWASLRTEPHGT